MGEWNQRLIDQLAGTYTLVVEPVIVDGRWLRRLEYPQLPGCRVDTESIEDGMDTLEVARIRTILSLVKAGDKIPTPNGRIPLVAVLTQVRMMGLSTELESRKNDGARDDHPNEGAIAG